MFRPSVVFLAAALARARTWTKQVFAKSMCRFSLFGLFCARPKNTEDGMKTSTANSQNAQRTAHAERSRPNVQNSSFLGAATPKSTPRLPKATPEACGSDWLANSAKIRDQEHPRDASKGFQVPPAGNETFTGGSGKPVSPTQAPWGRTIIKEKHLTTTQPGI